MISFYHLSHTDLDGYGCQLVSKKIFPEGYFYNANYGVEVKSTIKKILEAIENVENKVFFLITDLNLTIDEAKNLDKVIGQYKERGKDINLQLLDHHGTGEKASERFDWYFLDTSRSATKITYDYFINNFEEYSAKCSKSFSLLVEAIDDVDIWCENDPYFEFGKVATRLISSSQEINQTLFSNENREYRHYLLNKAEEYIEVEDGHVKLDDDLHKIKKEYLGQKIKPDTIDNLSAQYLVHLLENNKDELTVYYKEYKGLLTFTLSNISIPANRFLKTNPDYHFFMNISRRGNAGFRASNQIDVSLLAGKLANGGGHPNASGAYFNDFKETTHYQDVRLFIQNKLNAIE